MPVIEDITFELKRSRRRTLGLLIRPSGEIVAQAPLRAPQDAIDHFVQRHLEWIRRTRRRLQERAAAFPPPVFSPGETFALWGQPLRLDLEPEGYRQARLRAEAGRWILSCAEPPSPLQVRRAFRAYYKEEVQLRLEQSLEGWCERMQVSPRRLSVGFARHRWGSCSGKGHVRLNGRLAMLAPALFEYVLVHELAHLRQPNHSPRFWALVAAQLPDFKERRRELRRQSACLSL